MTVAIIYIIDGKKQCMLFGDSYKKWPEQAQEYEYDLKHNRKVEFERDRLWYCKQPWVSYGGLKWCSPAGFQAELDKEGKGRNFAEWVFKPLDRKADSKVVETARFAPRKQ